MKFTKMHGLGNDYVYVNGFVERVDDPVALVPKIADRHFGVGGDGLIMILPSTQADVRMRMFNADGTESEMCGNGIRCVAKFAYDHGLSKSNPMLIETGRGVLSLSLVTNSNDKVEQVTVRMGEPILELDQIPIQQGASGRLGHFAKKSDHEYLLSVGHGGTLATFVSMGNPHAVVFVDDVGAVDVPGLGPTVEHFGAFPKRINAHWVQVHSPGEVTMRTWERGSGVTLACGTGACAVCVAGVLTGRTARKLLAHLPGGDLTLEWREADNQVYMTGPATEVFSGEWPG